MNKTYSFTKTQTFSAVLVKKVKIFMIIAFAIIGMEQGAWGQTNYYSKSTGSLHLTATWGTSTDGSGSAPSNFTTASCIYHIQNNSSPTITASWAVSGASSKVIVGDGTNTCVFTIPSGLTYSSVATDISNAGTVKNQNSLVTSLGTCRVLSGATFEHNITSGTIPTATWNSGSNCIVTGMIGTAPAGTNQTFDNFTWNCPSQTGDCILEAAKPNAINGTFLVASTGSGLFALGSSNTARALTIGRMEISGGSFYVAGIGSTAVMALSITNDFSQSGGTFEIGRSNVSAGTCTIGGSYTNSGGLTRIMNNSGIGGIISTLTVTGDVTITGNATVTGGILDINVAGSTNAGRLFIKGNLNISSGSVSSGTLQYSQAQTSGSSGVYFDGTGTQSFTHSGGTLATVTGGVGRRFYYKSANGPTILNETYSASVAQTTINGSEGSPASGYSAWLVGAVVTNNIIISNSSVTGVALGAATTIKAGGSCTINAGSILSTGYTLTNIGTTAVNGTFQLNSGGWATGTAFVYGSSGMLSFNHTSSYGVNSGDIFWPTTSGPVNVNVKGSGGMTLNSGADRTVSGVFQTSGPITLSAPLTCNGTCQINTNGSFNLAPFYGSSSTLIYNTVSNFAASQEWYVNTTTGAGVPQNVTIASGSSLYFSGGYFRMMRGDLNFSTPFTATSTLALSSATGGDLYIGGNWNKASGGVFAPNGRLVKFNGSSSGQTITSSGGETFAYLELNNSNGLTLANDITVNNTLTLTSGLITTGNNTLTTGSSTISGASATSYIDGKLARVITSQTTTSFPVGKGGNYRPVTFTYAAAPTSKTVTIEQFESGSPLSLSAVSTAHSGNRYWNITQSATGIGYTVGLNNSGFSPAGTTVILRREGTGTATSNATSFSTPTYTSSSSFSTTDVSNDVQLGETAIPLTVTTAAATGKIYDKTNTAAITGTLSGVVSPDVVTLNGTGTFASVNVADGISVASTSTLAGANAGAYTLTQPTGLIANITARALTITGAANSKTYDGNTSSATNPTITSGALQSGDVAPFTQVYDNATVGTSKVMTPSGIVTDGNSGNNYSYTFVTSSNGIITSGSSTSTWNGSISSNWSTPANWTPAVAPTTGISAIIVSAGSAPIISTTGNECADLTITSGSLSISSSGTLTVSGSLTNNMSQSGLVIESNASSSGSLITSSSPPATVQRYLTNYISVNDQKFHFVSSPVSAQAIQPEFVPSAINSGQDFFAYSEPDNSWINSKTSGNIWNTDFDTYFAAGKGYMVAYPTAAVLKNFKGNLNSYPSGTPLAITCTYTSTKGKGWNLLGNPFTSAIDWDIVTKGDGIDAALYYYDAAAQNYRYYIRLGSLGTLGGGSRYIPAMQGFMVHANSTGTSKTVTIQNGNRVHQAQTTYYKSTNTVPGSLSLKVAANGLEDEAYIYFNANATNSFDGQYDAYKLRSYNTSVPALYTNASDGSELAINGLPEIAENAVIPVSFVAGMDGEYTLSANLQNIPNAIVYLIDTKLDKTQNLSANAVYTFNASTTDQPSRFKLTFNSVGIIEPGNAETLRIYMEAGNLYVSGSFTANTEIRVTNMLGQIMLRARTSGNALTTLNANSLPNGVYVVSLVSGSKSVSRKIV
ncbi:MAG: YDG domain-containing protein, partial [Bacteroidales bacterium]